MKCGKCGNYINYGVNCFSCGYDNKYSLKWYKVLLVILLISIIVSVSSAIIYFSGGIYQEFADKTYNMFPSLRVVDTFYGIVSLAMAVYIFIVWRALKNYKKNVHILLTILYVLNIIFTLVYSIAFNSIIEGAATTIIYGDINISGMYKYIDLRDIVFSSSDIISIIGTILSGDPHG